MRVDLTINDIGNDWEFNGERVWKVQSNNKTYSFISPHRPVIGSYIPCMVEERPGTNKQGRAITYRDARPIPQEELTSRQYRQDDVPNFPTPQAERDSYQRQKELDNASKQAEKPQTLDPRLETPDWAKPGPKPTLTGDLVLINRYLDALLNHPKIKLENEVNWLGGFSSVIATGLRDYHDGKLVVETDVIPDDVRRAYLEAADGQWPGEGK